MLRSRLRLSLLLSLLPALACAQVRTRPIPRRWLRQMLVVAAPPATCSGVIAVGAVRPPGSRLVYVSWVAQPAGQQAYLVQRSLDGAQWEDVGFVDAREPDYATTHFSYEDRFSGGAYYRVGSYDAHGTLRFSLQIIVPPSALDVAGQL